MKRMAFHVALLFTLAVLLHRSSFGSNVRVGEPFRIYPSSITQTEPFIARHPSNPSILFVAANTVNTANGFISEGIYVSTNSGATWRGSDTCNGAPITFHRGDPAITIDKNGVFILTRLGFSPGLYAHNSVNNGLNWGSQRTIASEDQDRASLQSDILVSSGNYGRTYSAWVRFLGANPPVFFAYSDNSGSNWSAPVQINSPSMRGQGAELSIGPNGRINVCWAGVTSTSPFTEDIVGFATSTNGGVNWTVAESAFDVNGIQGIFAQKSNIRANGLPKIDSDKTGGTRNGWVYIVTTERNLAPAGTDPDIILHRSTNNGQTWSAGIRVNRDALNNGKSQFFPAIHVDDGGGVNVLYYDDRNTTADSATVYLSRSTDGGTTWSDYRVNSNNFKPTPIGGLGQGYQGDNIGMTSAGDTLWPVWMDNSSGIYQIWTCPIRISGLTSVNDASVPERFALFQNYPNPFNPATTIEFSVGTSSDVSLRVFDVLGREVATLVNEPLHAGTYSTTWDATKNPSGIYFYAMQAGTFRATRKIALVK